MQVSERDLEDFIEANIGAFVRADAVCVGRQVILPSDRRLDLLAAHEEAGNVVLTVVELKACRAGVEALVQLQDYVEELEVFRCDSYEVAATLPVQVRGLLLAPDLTPQVERLASRMPGMAARKLNVELVVTLREEPSVANCAFWVRSVANAVADILESYKTANPHGDTRAG